jgi:hypothetical protein
MWKHKIGPLAFADLEQVIDEAWREFSATSPAGIDLIGEASVRSMIANRIIRAAELGNIDRGSLKSEALRGL